MKHFAKHLQQFLHGRQGDMPEGTTLGLDVVLRELPFCKGDIGEGYECWRGYYPSLRPTHMGLSLNIDISATSFFKPVSVIMAEELIKKRNTSCPLADIDRVEVKTRRYKITGITPMSVAKLRFHADEQGTGKTVLQYFLDKYHYRLNYGLWPCLHAGSDSCVVYFPMEMDLHNRYAEDTFAHEFVVSLCSDLGHVPACVLPSPLLKSHNPGRNKTHSSVGQWSMIIEVMINGGTIGYWTCLNFSCMCPDEVHRFCMDLNHMCNVSPMVAINPESKLRSSNKEVLNQLAMLDGKLPSASLPFESDEVAVALLHREKMKESAERKCTLTMQVTGKVDSYHLQQFLYGRQRDMPEGTIQGLDVVLRKLPFCKGDIGEGHKCWRGYYPSLCPTQVGLSLNIDISATSFFKPVSVIMAVEELVKKLDTSCPLADIDRVEVKKALRGVRIKTTHRQDRTRRYKITGITSISTGQLSFPVDEWGTRKTVLQYLLDTYNYILKYGLWPCLRAGSNSQAVYFPEIQTCVILLFVSLSLTQCANGNIDKDYCNKLGSRILGSCSGGTATRIY